MKKLITILFLLVVVAGYAQPGFTPVNNKVKFYGISAADGRMSLPQDTFAVTGTDQNYPWVAEKSDKMWRWSTAQLKWVEMSEKNVSWAGDIYPVLSDTLLNYQHLLPVGSVTEYYRGDQTLGNFEGDVITVTNPLYVQYGDTTSVQTPLRFNYPLYKSDSSNVHVAWNEPTWNAARIQNIFMQVGTPTRNGMTWVYDSTANQWRHGFITPDGTVIPGIDTLSVSSDTLYWQKSGNTYAEVLPATFTNTDETDETALAQAISVNQGNGVTILGSPTQTLGGTPSWTINADVTTADVYADNLLVQPGYVTWRGTGLTFDVTAATYDIAHMRYNSAAGQITLDAADATNPRIDVIAVDNTGSIVKITGTAEANPVQPQIDPSTQVLLTSILLPAGATTPYGVSDEVIYDENTEWTSAAGGLTANFDNASNNYNGSKSAAISGFSNGQYVQWTDAVLNAAANQVLSMQVRLSSNWNNSNNASVMLMRGAVPISQSLLITNYGLVKTVTGGYQTVNIPITAFSPTDSFDRVRISFIGNSGNTVNVDYVRLQSGITNVTTTSHKIGLSMPPAFAVSGPVVNTGTLTVVGAGAATQVIDGTGNLTELKTINGNSLIGSGNISISGGTGTPTWGTITGTLADQTDLQTALDGKANTSHTHDASDIVSGTLNTARIASGTATATYVPISNGDGTATWGPQTGGGTSTHTVTLSMPSAFTVTPTSITNGGAITVTVAGTSTQVIAGTGSLVNNTGVQNFQTSGGTYTLTLKDGTVYTGTLSGGGSAKDTLQHTITIPTPTDAEDWTIFYSKKAITIHEVAEVVRGSSSPSATYYIAFGSNRGVESNYLFSSSRTASSTVGATTNTFSDATVPAGSFIFIKTTAISGTISELSVTLTFTNDD